MDKTRLNVPTNKNAADRLATIANKLEFAGVSDLVRAALADYCQRHGQPITVEELSPGQWGGSRRAVKEGAES